MFLNFPTAKVQKKLELTKKHRVFLIFCLLTHNIKYIDLNK